MDSLNTYSRTNWQDYPNTSSPINAQHLNHMEDGIYEADLKGSIAVNWINNFEVDENGYITL